MKIKDLFKTSLKTLLLAFVPLAISFAWLQDHQKMARQLVDANNLAMQEHRDRLKWECLCKMAVTHGVLGEQNIKEIDELFDGLSPDELPNYEALFRDILDVNYLKIITRKADDEEEV